MPPTRDLTELMPRLLAAIPEPDVRAALDERTRSIISSTRFTAPECMYLRWHELGDALVAVLGQYRQANPPWLEELREIFAGTR